jgi:hypothetical protein
MIAYLVRIGRDTLIGLIVVAALAVVFLAAPSGGKPDRPAASDVPGHAHDCAVCQLPAFGRAGSPSQLGPGSDEAETSSSGSQAQRASPRPMPGNEAQTGPPEFPAMQPAVAEPDPDMASDSPGA